MLPVGTAVLGLVVNRILLEKWKFKQGPAGKGWSPAGI
jgi:hypothetical protein